MSYTDFADYSTTPCPYCGATCYADWCDVGVGMVQIGPFHCEDCGASEQGPHDKDRELTAMERETGWYGPGSVPGSSANVIGGRIVSSKTMDDLYRNHFENNPRYDIEGEVERWWEEVRK